MTSCTTRGGGGITLNSAARLNYVKIEDVSCLSYSEKKDLTFNKCVIYAAKYGKFTKACKKLIGLVD